MTYPKVSVTRGLGCVLGRIFRAVPSDLQSQVSFKQRCAAAVIGTHVALLLALVAGLVLVGVTDMNNSLSSRSARGRQAVPFDMRQRFGE